MGVQAIERAILEELRKVASNPRLKAKDLLEWSTGEIDPHEGETPYYLPQLKIHCSVKLPSPTVPEAGESTR